MNGIHDMGGMHGMGPLQYEKDEPFHHADWEARVDAMTAAMRAAGKIPGLRRGIEEKISAADYLRMSYYERWLTSLTEMLIARGLVTREEVDQGRPAASGVNSARAVSATEAVEFMRRNVSPRQNIDLPLRFQVGQKVRARNINPVTYTRLPRYTRGRLGTIDSVRGVFPIPDSDGGNKPENLYSVRFPARELWGEQAAPQDAVYVDMWDGYLEPA
jgi:nitrile hydratase subunit beta